MNLVRRLTTIAGALAWPSVCVVAGAVMFVICFGGTRLGWNGGTFGYGEWWEHGWPLVFLRRSADHVTSRFSFAAEPDELYWGPLAFDILIFIGVVGALVTGPYLIAARQRIERRVMVFSLSTMFFVVTFACLLLGNIGQSLSSARREQAAVAKLRKAGHVHESKYIGPRWLARLNGDLTTEHLQSFQGVRMLRLVLNDEPDFAQLVNAVQELKNLDQLLCSNQATSNYRLTDASFDALLTRRQRSRLRVISLYYTQVTGSAFADPQEWPRLDVVNLQRSSLDDAGFENLAKIRTIYHLDVSGTLITKRSLERAASMPRLTVFYAKNCGFTESDVAALKARNVTCVID
jgi:hypothetical protein